jgi:hypothetical protein
MKFLSGCTTGSFLRRSQLHEVTYNVLECVRLNYNAKLRSYKYVELMASKQHMGVALVFWVCLASTLAILTEVYMVFLSPFR